MGKEVNEKQQSDFDWDQSSPERVEELIQFLLQPTTGDYHDRWRYFHPVIDWGSIISVIRQDARWPQIFQMMLKEHWKFRDLCYYLSEGQKDILIKTKMMPEKMLSADFPQPEESSELFSKQLAAVRPYSLQWLYRIYFSNLPEEQVTRLLDFLKMKRADWKRLVYADLELVTEQDEQAYIFQQLSVGKIIKYPQTSCQWEYDLLIAILGAVPKDIRVNFFEAIPRGIILSSERRQFLEALHLEYHEQDIAVPTQHCGVDLNKAPNDGTTPVQFAEENSQVEVLAKFKEWGIGVNVGEALSNFSFFVPERAGAQPDLDTASQAELLEQVDSHMEPT